MVPHNVLTAAAAALERHDIAAARDLFADWLAATNRALSPWTVLLDFALATHNWPAAEQVAQAWSTNPLPSIPIPPPPYPTDDHSLWFRLALRASEAARFDDACRYWTEAARFDPSSPDLWGNLAACELSRGHLDAAHAAAQRAVALDPAFATGWDRLGLIAQAQGDATAALAHHDRAVQLAPASAGSWINLAAAALAGEQASRAKSAAEQALTLDSSRPEAWFNLAAAADHLGLTRDAALAYDRALRTHTAPPPAWHLQRASLLPAIYPDHAAVVSSRHDLTSDWQALIDAPIRFDPARLPCPIRFRLAYQGFNDRPLQELAARVMTPSRFTARPTGSGGRRLRVGFVSKFLKDHTVGHLTAGLILSLPTDRYETIVFHLGSARGPVADRIHAGCSHHVELPLAVEPAATAIANACLDVLVYPDIGMEPITLSLSYLRLAPRQLVLWGHPVTTGSSALDGFVSSRLCEPTGAQAHYTEPLLELPLLPGILTPPSLDGPTPTRAEFHLPPHGPIYLCPQSLFKLHPDMDALFAGLLAADPTGWIGLIEPPEPVWRNQLEARWQNAAWTRRIVWIPRVDPAGFLRLLATASVLLDTRPFGGGYTTYQALALGVPVVTWPGDFLRGRVTLGCYQQMGRPDGPASSADEYIARAITWAHSPPPRHDLADQARALFHREDLLTAWEAALQEAR